MRGRRKVTPASGCRPTYGSVTSVHEPCPDDREPVRVEADGAELEAPRDQAVTAVLEEGEQVERTWTASDFADKDWEHPDTRPRMRGWLHLFAFFGAIVAGAVLIPLASVARRRAPGFSVGALLPDDPRAVRRSAPSTTGAAGHRAAGRS